ncbi:peptide chain release factor N(5)-glutamine methyltransferase [Pseudidiomarina gelatinasegens]|jgi:release factor glutamine methyltransferase|uniref:Release factor glutamine methyltransferase n=1 Tax=Pseudidiomarina gelatinasegens TaxID=2487740 RepID=A0A443Z772_9GAMM|nr:peptide chain release factor N(5)-glutamine methyltransferase [Pseudidiomarina gelatinasegens]RWU12711.1 peptide chain release factor N(5)-glutamine methyltransferase [Pseudidiomarina gelatinasegens]
MITLQQPVSIADALATATRALSHSESAKLDAEVLLAFCLQRERIYLYTWPERQLNAEQTQQFEQLLAKRQQGTPVAHLVGEREFWSLPLRVNDSTLIPRPDTEILVEQTLALGLADDAQVLDLGTGTGAIALALKSSKPQWRITAVDKSPAAVELARSNASALQLSINCQISDWFSGLPANDKFDAIVSNPPYIDAGDPHLQQGDVRFEPRSALVADNQGLADIEHIISQAGRFLRADGWLLVEHGWNQAAAVRGLMASYKFEAVNSMRDYANLERITVGQWRATDG